MSPTQSKTDEKLKNAVSHGRPAATPPAPAAKVCKQCLGDPQPIDNFQRSATAADGFLNVCNACMRARRKQGRQRAKAARLGLPHAVRAVSGKLADKPAKKTNDRALVIDFSNYKEVFDALHARATEQMRSPGMQTLYITLTAMMDGDAKMVEFLQRLFGMAICGNVVEKIFPVLIGPGGNNGKNTLIETISGVIKEAVCQ